MSRLREEILKLAERTILTNQDIASILGCSRRTVNRYAGSHSDRCRLKSHVEDDLLRIKKCVLLSDIHYPRHDVQSLTALEEFMADYQPDEIVYMGDQLTLESISSWNRRKPLIKEGQRLLNEYKGFDKEILRRHESITGPNCKRVFMIGNHEQRLHWYVEEYPELEGLIDIDYNLKLTERGYEIIEYNNVYKIGKLNVIHGFYWNKYHSWKTLDVFEGNVVYGHVHNPQMFCKLSPIDQKGYHMATCLPCLSTTKPDYQENAPNAWVNGFGIVEHMPSTKLFNLYTVIINNGSFMYNGKCYGL